MENYYLGPVPCGENCAQLGHTPDYNVVARKECRAYINQLSRQFRNAPIGVYLKTKWNKYDLGVGEVAEYPEVIVCFDENDENACDFAQKMESSLPEFWDEEAKKELGIL